SESAVKVLEVASRIAKAYAAHLIVLFPYRLITNGFEGDIPSLKRKLETEAKEKYEALKKTVADEPVSSEFVSEIGFVADRIAAHVNRKNIDMVVIGQQQTASNTDPRSFDLQKLIAASKLPFVIVPAEVNANASV